MNMPKLTMRNRRIIILGIILLSLVGALVGQFNILAIGIGGLIAFIKDDGDE